MKKYEDERNGNNAGNTLNSVRDRIMSSSSRVGANE